MVKSEKHNDTYGAVRREDAGRQVRHLIAGESAAQSIGDIWPNMELFGLTNGQFSIINLFEHILKQTGPANMDISTWTAANAEVKLFEQFLNNEKITRLRFLFDRSFPNRQKEYFPMILQMFGTDAVRLARCHAKFAVIYNDKWHLAIRTSMNLNENKRIENFEISDDSKLASYITGIFDQLFEQPFSSKGYVLGANIQAGGAVENVEEKNSLGHIRRPRVRLQRRNYHNGIKSNG